MCLAVFLTLSPSLSPLLKIPPIFATLDGSFYNVDPTNSPLSTLPPASLIFQYSLHIFRLPGTLLPLQLSFPTHWFNPETLSQPSFSSETNTGVPFASWNWLTPARFSKENALPWPPTSLPLQATLQGTTTSICFIELTCWILQGCSGAVG